MPDIPVNTVTGYLGVLILLLGLFLVLTGMGIVNVQTVVVAPGKKTLVFGIIFIVLGIFSVQFEAMDSSRSQVMPTESPTQVFSHVTPATGQSENIILVSDTPTPSTILATPAPKILSFSTCLQACDGTNSAKFFPEKVTKIYAQWDYENIPTGARYIRSWKMQGKEWVRYDCIWPGPTTGSNMVTLEEPDGLHSGTWEVSISVNGVTLVQEEVFIAGNWNFWYPVGIINSCFGKVPNQSSTP